MRTALTAFAFAVAAAPPIFQFETGDFWLNLHHFLYVLGRAEAGLPDASGDAVKDAPADQARGLEAATEAERRIWSEAVRVYAAGPSRKDLVFDERLVTTTGALAEERGQRLSEGFCADDPKRPDCALAAALEKAAPVYRKVWWPAHRSANEARRASTQALVDRHGAAVLAFVEKAFGLKWPESGYPVHLSGYANWAGAYSTDQRLLVMSSLDRDTRGLAGLETVFHEGMHQWDQELFVMVRDQARKINKLVPANLTHALIFFTAGEAVRRVEPDHVPYAEAAGVWQRGMAVFRQALIETWKPYLDGRGTRDEALAALVARVATQPRGHELNER